MKGWKRGSVGVTVLVKGGRRVWLWRFGVEEEEEGLGAVWLPGSVQPNMHAGRVQGCTLAACESA
ncbi:uncharacterized protein G2W53_041345 [Senna tora]|uniref:Uncharacterized protein n=1 Tax=Senna tora TaxID=362788 RepID=A0A834W2T3_9FABA|nr:uncharacterized protein G2W53_041345 [Senna tora]